uniref:Secreted protein n=1 Tax=Panstrongylus lignarius TaxID=156445 RepID=A0A224Y1I1_9HEMI
METSVQLVFLSPIFLGFQLCLPSEEVDDLTSGRAVGLASLDQISVAQKTSNLQPTECHQPLLILRPT